MPRRSGSFGTGSVCAPGLSSLRPAMPVIPPATKSIPLSRVGVWLILLLLIGISAHGGWVSGILDQQPSLWSPLGLRRLLEFAGSFWAIFAITLPRRSWFRPSIVCLALAWGFAATGLRPTAAVLLFLFSSYLWGALLPGAGVALRLILGM